MTAKTLASAWHGAYLLDGGAVVREVRSSLEVEALAEDGQKRAAGETTPAEQRLLDSRGEERWRTRDRRLAGDGVVLDPSAPDAPDVGADPAVHRTAMLRRAELALAAAWDPSVHVEEAVRALRDIDRASNLIGERVSSWAALDLPELEGQAPLAAAKALLERPPAASFSPEGPSVIAARRRLAELFLALGDARSAVDEALLASVPVRAPNLNRLLGPELAARMIAQAGGLDRLAHLPASTVQVLGAERAFFEHLRGRAPPPRHGLLFLHPAVQSAPRAQRGKLARSLAAKVAIASRLDRAGAAVNPALAEAFEARRTAIRAAGAGGRRGRTGRALRPPLDRAPDDR